MAEAIYTGSAARYMLGGILFEKDQPKDVTDDMAKYLATVPEFKVDGKGGVVAKAKGEEESLYPVIPVKGFTARADALAFAKKWVPDAGIEAFENRSVTELQRRIEAALAGQKCDDQGYPVSLDMAALAAAATEKAKKVGKAVTV